MIYFWYQNDLIILVWAEIYARKKEGQDLRKETGIQHAHTDLKQSGHRVTK